MTKIHTLTGLRGLAASIVFISHAANESMLPHWLGKGFGKVGVMLFFVLSGFLIAHLYINEEFSFCHIKKYALSRIGRVLPLFYALILVSVLISRLSSVDFCYSFPDTETIISAVLCIKAPSLFWTIPVEVQFYVIFVGIWAMYKKLSPKAVWGLLGLYVLFRVALVFVGPSSFPDFLTRYSGAFLLGVMTALLYRRFHNDPRVQKWTQILAVPVLLLSMINLPVLRLHYGLFTSQSEHMIVWDDPITWCLVYLFFLCALMNAKGLSFLNKGRCPARGGCPPVGGS